MKYGVDGMVTLDELITDFTVGPDGMIYGYNPFSEEYLFMFCKSSE